MPCVKFGLSVNGDIDGKLLKDVEFVAGIDDVKSTLLAGYVSSAEFLEFFKQDSTVAKQVDDVDSITSVLDSRINTNTRRRVLKEFYNTKKVSVNNYVANRNVNSLGGFRNDTALQEAMNYNALLIQIAHIDNITKPKSERLKKVDIIKKINKEINDRFLNNYVIPLLNEVKLSSSDNARKLSTDFENINNDFENAKKEYIKLVKELKTNNNADKNAIKNRLNELKLNIDDLSSKRYVAAVNLINEFGTDRAKNFSALVQNIRQNTNEWYKKVFGVSRLINISKDFEETLESGKLMETNAEDEYDVDNSNSENTDQTTKSWVDKGYKSFDKAVSDDVKLYLDTLFKLDAKGKLGESNYSYDTNNELGVPKTMGANFLITQLSTQGNFASVNDFIKSVYNLSQNVPELYGLIQMVNKMRNDYNFACKVFVELANPQVIKTMITLGENGIAFERSNKNSSRVSYMFFQMLNNAKSRYREVYNTNDKNILLRLQASLNKDNATNFANASDLFRSSYLNEITRIIYSYFPNIKLEDIQNYLKKDLNNYKFVVNQLLNLVNVSDKIIDDYNKLNDEYKAELRQFNKDKRLAEETIMQGIIPSFTKQSPILDLSKINYSRFNAPIIELAKVFSQYNATRVDLNTTNAEGHLASDLIKNNYITNLFKQIQFGTDEDANKGLELLKNYITKGEQYRYEPIFFGVTDSKGNVIVEGLFKRNPDDSVIINPNAKKILSYSLFDGAKDFDNVKAVMYNNMSKADYFISQIVAFENPFKTEELLEDKTNIFDKLGGFFLRTPSDAPKNFILQAPKYKFDGLFSPVTSSVNNYIKTIKDTFNKKLNFNVGDFELDLVDKLALDKNENNNISANDLYQLLIDSIKGNIDNISYNNKQVNYNEKTNEVVIPLQYKTNNTQVVVFLKGTRVIGETNNIAENLKLDKVFSIDGTIPQSVFDANMDIIKKTGIERGYIQVNTNTENQIFRGFRTHLLGELNTYIDQLYNLFKPDNNGVYRLRKDTTGLIGNAHYKEDLVKDGKLTGKFFKFEKLFELDNYDTNKAMDNALLLYGGGDKSLFKTDQKGMYIDLSRTDLITVKNGRLVLNISDSVNEALTNITKEWITNFNLDIIKNTKEFNEILKNNDISDNEVTAAIMNYAIMNMNFDSIFEGSSKFYKDARSFLKRAKEAQAGGKVYAGYNISDEIGTGVHEIKTYDGEDVIIGTQESPYLLPRKGSDGRMQLPESESGVYRKARNGFKAITITNSVRPSKQAQLIHDEVYDNLVKEMPAEQAEKIAAQIAKGYRDNTTVNDAQSYITIDEFIARRYADGTIEEYRDILQQLQDVREGKKKVEDIDLSNINARIQVQKNFYYDMTFDDTTKTYYPRQIKNAEFVLIPELIKGTELETLYNIMKENGIDQINTAETSKAAKKNVLTFWDNDGNINPNFDADIKANNNAAIEDFYYRYLYKQQDVPQHLMDEENKAGIQIMKKILDNINENAHPELKDEIKKFFTNYCANIKMDFNSLMNDMGWKVVDGKIVNAKDGSSDLDFTEFYKKTRIEAQRLGMDSNFAEYLTPDPSTGKPIMPNFMNNVSTKLESIAQSIFNSAVTRQTLPGWHAAQVTSVGHGRGVLDENGKMRELKYHPAIEETHWIITAKDGSKIIADDDNILTNYLLSELSITPSDLEGKNIREYAINAKIIKEETTVIHEAYAEVLVPRWSNLISKETTAEQLAEEGLDIQLAYRIPTEGKQSVSVIKVVRFLNDVYGSTIMVPDEWVTQTGSDFDVDSIYAICYRMYKDRDGKLHKVKPDYDKSEEGVIRRYEKYINSNLKHKVERTEINTEEKQAAFNKIYDELNGERSRNNNAIWKNASDIANDAYKLLPKKYKDKIKGIINTYKNNKDLYSRFVAINKEVSKLLENETNEEVKINLENYVDATESLIEMLAKQKGIVEDTKFNERLRSAKKEKFNELVNVAKEDYFNKVQKAASDAGLMSFEEFSMLTLEEQQFKDARDNMILDSMINIMKNDNSREENYSRSNFDDLTETKEFCDELRGATKLKESPYNPFTQINFMENAMSGAQLKAFSVTRDTFNSVNNHCKSRLAPKHTITVEYNLNEYDAEVIKLAYPGQYEIDESRNVIIVHHNRIGNSANNRNVVGKLLTPYSSQTTAHILDAIKTGSIFNENDYTFGTFKTLVDVGIDYKTAIAFLMQPAITRINNAYYKSKSIFTKAGGNNINTAIREIANELGLTIRGKSISQYEQMENVWAILNGNERLQNAFKSLFGVEISPVNGIDGLSTHLDGMLLLDRLNESGIFNNTELSDIDKQYYKAAFDLYNIINFRNVYNTTKNIESLARCANPDRFGAKQTVKSTRDKIEDIINFATDDKNETANTILVGKQNIIQALYPGVGTAEGIDVENSAYPYLAAFLKYSTIPSVEINKKLFTLEGDNFYAAIKSAEDALGCKFSEDTVKEYNQYLVNDAYNAVPFFNTPQTISKDGYIIDDVERIKENEQSDTFYWKAENARIFGFDVTVSSNLKVDDINHPTAEELAIFNKMTPAQKVLWIQSTFSDGKGIFDLLSVNTFNQFEYKNKGFTSQTIKFNDSNSNIEEVYKAFRDSFFSTNPLIKSVAVDLVKYAFVVEGFRFKKGGISKIITNDVLYSHKSDYGCDIIQNTNGVNNQLGTTISNALNNVISFTGEDTNTFLTKFVRSHSDIVKEFKLPRAERKLTGGNITDKWNMYTIGDDMVYIPFNNTTKDLLSAIGFESENSPKRYIKINKYITNKERKVTLYKINPTKDGIYLIPLNLLERNEVSDYSVNNKNNKYPSEEYYKAVIDYSKGNNIIANSIISDKTGSYELGKPKDAFVIKPHKSKYIVESAVNPNEFIRISNTASGVAKASINQFMKDVADYITSTVEKQGKYGVIRNTSKNVSNTIPFKTKIIQNIPIGDSVVPVRISRDFNTSAFKSIAKALELKTTNIQSLPIEYKNAVQRSIDARDSINGIQYYKVEQLTDEETKDLAENGMFATTSSIEEATSDTFGKVDQTAKNIYEALNLENKRNRTDTDAAHFIKTMNIRGLNPYSSRSIRENKNSIYTESAKYYTGLAHSILDKMSHIKTDDGREFDITNPELYKYMLDHEELYPEVLKLILDAKTFGGAFYDIFNLNIEGEDSDTQKAIKNIRDAINSVRHNDKLEIAIDLIFNNFLANKLSTNPLVREGIVNVREAFKDTDWFDLQLSDIAEIDNKQIQIAVKYAYQVLYEATTVEAPKAAREFEKKYDDIMKLAGDFNIDNIITPDGRLVPTYTDKFITDKKALNDAVQQAKDTYGEDSIEYYKAKLARDKFRAKNMQQEVVNNYYNEINEITDRVLKFAGKEYVEYMKLIHQLYKDGYNNGKLTEEEVAEKKAIFKKINQLLSDVDASENIKDDVTLDRIEVLRNFIKAKKAINNKYFDYNESDGFKSTLQYYTKIIKNYEAKHPNETIDMKLEDEGFATAYNWIKTNTNYTLTPEAKLKVKKAFETLGDITNPNSKSKFINEILSKAKAYDEYGNIDARKLSADDIKAIKEFTQNKYTGSYDSNAGDAILIKNVPSGLPVFTNEFYRKIRAEGEREQNPVRLATIKRINEILGKVIDKNGNFKIADLFDKVTRDERIELARLYKTLRGIKSKRSKESLKEFKKNVKFETYQEGFNEALAYAQTQLKNTKEYDELLDIIVQTDKNGMYMTDKNGHFIPNNELYGYLMPVDDKYIDKEKTEARQLVENDLRFVTNEYYYAAMKEATKAGKFDEWFDANHVYNPYTHKMEPLAVWTTMEVNPNGNLAGEYEYAPTYDNIERSVKKEYINSEYNSEDSVNYNADTGDYNGRAKLTNKERKMLNLFQSTINKYATNYGSRRFASKGFMPRRAKYTPDARWYIGQALGAAGLEWRNTKESRWSEQVDYLHDHDIDFDMMQLLKAKGYIDINATYSKPIRYEGESDTDFEKRLEEYRKNVEEAEKHNLELDNKILDRDWKSVMLDFVTKGTEHQARERIKNPLYLLLEDLKSNPAYKTSVITGKVKENRKLSTDENTVYQETAQNNSYAIAQNWIRRIVYNEFKKDSSLKNWADLMQNMTSAKYMIFNVTGGIANVGTGIANIMNEVFASEYFNNSQYLSAKSQYLAHSVSMIRDLYSDKSTSFESGLTKYFNVVDFDAFNERRPNETASEYVKRVRDSLYSMQSAGEHYMQNTVLFAMLKSSRIFNDIDGRQRVGTIADYIWKIEQETLRGFIDNREDLRMHYDTFVKNIKKDKTLLRKYDNFSRDFNADFLREVDNKRLIEEYTKARNKAIKEAKKKFNSFKTLESQFELVDGNINIKADSTITGKDIADFRNRVIEVNKKIHGVYDKIGAAKIESEWWGGLVMQYHKHIYPGIMRRWRVNGYYNEQRGSMERGSYISLAKYLSTDFDGIINRIKTRQADNNENIALASIKEVVKSCIDTVLNFHENWELLPEWERRNIKRNLGDLYGIMSALFMSMCIYMMTDDDDLKESEVLATSLYMTDRLLSEAQMYTPWGLSTEAKTMWSSPIAVMNTPQDLIQSAGWLIKLMYDDEFDPNYTTGLYKGQNKFAVKLKRNIPILRVYDRLTHMTKNNSYYRIDDNALNLKVAKNIADTINPD